MGLKIYVQSDLDDSEVENIVSEMSAFHLRLALYGIARGDSFDESLDLAVSVQKRESESGDWKPGASKRVEPFPTIFNYSEADNGKGIDTVEILVPVKGEHPTLLTIDLNNLTVSAEGYD